MTLIQTRLMESGDLTDLGLEIANGRSLVKELAFPRALHTGLFDHGGKRYETVAGNAWVVEKKWHDIHFLRCDFADVRYKSCVISNCVFERCACERIGFWDSQVENCVFRSSNLRSAALGGIDTIALTKKPNAFVNCQFVKCDLRSSAHSCEIYRNCVFQNCRLDGVLFLGAVFEDCVFRGRLNRVEFRDRFDKDVAPNRLHNCNFQQAELVDCQFIRLDLAPSMFASDDDLIWLHQGPDDLRRWQERFANGDTYIETEARLAGTPTFLKRSELQRAGFSEQEIQWIVDIASTEE